MQQFKVVMNETSNMSAGNVNHVTFIYTIIWKIVTDHLECASNWAIMLYQDNFFSKQKS